MATITPESHLNEAQPIETLLPAFHVSPRAVTEAQIDPGIVRNPPRAVTEEQIDPQQSTSIVRNPTRTVVNTDCKEELALAKSLVTHLEEGKTSVQVVCSSEVVQNISKRLEQIKSSLGSQRTAVLWMLYMDMIDILRKSIKAERTGNWSLHLQSVYDMLPYFAATGHIFYAKSAYIYLQMMQDLKNKNPAVYKCFDAGHHVARRSDRYWAGLSTDLMIEQVLMRSAKTSGGLTRGKGLTEVQRLVWLMSMPACAEVNDAMQTLTTVR